MKEIERKFLLKEDYKITDLLWVKKELISDYYIKSGIRIRNKSEDVEESDLWFVTIKSEGQIERDEVEVPIMCKPTFIDIPVLKKVRITIPFQKHNFEVNMFADILYRGKQLILIEIELKDKNEEINLPEWVGEEVTDDERFYGSALANFLKYKDFSIKESITN